MSGRVGVKLKYLDLRSYIWVPIGISKLLRLEACFHRYMLSVAATRCLNKELGEASLPANGKGDRRYVRCLTRLHF